MKKICSVLSTALLAALLILALLVVGPMVAGYQGLAVLSGSMEPNIPVGAIVYVDDDVTADELEVGDVITYSLESGTYVTHRVISIDSDSKSLVTQGDANDAPDGDIQFTQVFGRVGFHIPYLGYVIANIKTSKGIMAITAVIVVIIALNFIPAIFSADGKDSEKKNTVKKDEKNNNHKEI